MYKRIILSACALLMAGTASAWKIEGRITGVADKDSVEVLLFRYWGNSGRSIATDTLRRGRFSFSGTLPADELVMMQVSARNGQGTGSLWMTDTTDMLITTDASGQWTVKSNEPEQAIERELRTIDLSDLDALMQTSEDYHKNRDSVWRVSAERLWPVYAKHPNSRAVLHDLTFYARQGVIPAARLQGFYERLTPENKASLEGESIVGALDPPQVPQKGEIFADFSGTDTTGIACKLSDMAGKGKYVLLDFWSVACGPCHAAFPQMKEIYGKYGDRLEIVGVSLDVNKERWCDVIRWKELPWKHISDGKGNFGGAYMLYRIEAMPTYVLIDPQGKIVERWYPGQGDFQSRMIEPYLDKQS